MEVDIPSEYVYLCGRWTEKYFNQKFFFFFIDRPISDELVALTFGFALFQFTKISNDAITNPSLMNLVLSQCIKLLPNISKDESKCFCCACGQKAAPNLILEDTFTAFSRSQTNASCCQGIGELTSSRLILWTVYYPHMRFGWSKILCLSSNV